MGKPAGAGSLRAGTLCAWSRGHVLSATSRSLGEGGWSGGPPSTRASGRKSSHGEPAGFVSHAALGPGGGFSQSGVRGQGNPAWVSVPLSVPPETEVQTPGVLGALNQDFFFFLSNY